MSDKDKQQLAETYDVVIMSRSEFDSVVETITSIKGIMFHPSKKTKLEDSDVVYQKAKEVYQNIANELSKIYKMNDKVVISVDDLRGVHYHLGVLLMKPTPSKLIRKDMNEILKGLKIEQ